MATLRGLEVARPLVQQLAAILRQEGVPLNTVLAKTAREAAFNVVRKGDPHVFDGMSEDYLQAWEDGGEVAEAFDLLWAKQQRAT